MANSPVRSWWAATGSISFRAKSRASSCSARCSSLRLKSMAHAFQEGGLMLDGQKIQDKGHLRRNLRPVRMIYRIVEMQLRQIKTPATIFFLITQAFLLHACAEDTLPSGSTAISGRVLTPNGDPISGAGIVVEYSTLAAGAAPVFPQTAD